MLQVIYTIVNQRKKNLNFYLDFFDKNVKCSKAIVLVISNCKVTKKGNMKKLLVNYFIL